MSIAFATDPTGAIATLDDLVEEIRDELDDSGYSLTKIYRAIARAEAYFNRELRVPQMETEYSFSVNTESTDLPSDFLQMRAIYQQGSPDRALRSMAPDGMRRLFMGQTGIAAAYAIEGRRLIVAPVGDADLTMLYYAAIPPLNEGAPTNWLLVEYPDIYLHHVLAILFNKTGDGERGLVNMNMAVQLIEQANKTGRNARFGAGPLNPFLVQQVSGTRI
jgi:hypothetical protein